MKADLYFLVIAVMVLALPVLFRSRGKRGGSNGEANGAGEENSLPASWDSLTSELSGRIFNPEDSDFVASESPLRIARSFRRQRAALALDWLAEVRKHFSLLMRAHRRAARDNPDLKPAGEVRLGFEFLLFEVTTGILYLVIWLIGPLHAAALVGYSLGLAGQLRKMTEDILPGGRRVAVELMDSEPHVGSRTGAP